MSRLFDYPVKKHPIGHNNAEEKERYNWKRPIFAIILHQKTVSIR